MIRDNAKGRVNAGISASTLTACPREVALMEKYDYYAPIPQFWIMGSGTVLHSAIEADDDPPWIMKERRGVRHIDVTLADGTVITVRLSGQMDRVDTKYRRLIDYKQKEKVPWKPDETHEFQWNFYRWILADCILLEDKVQGLPEEPFSIDIVGGGMYYVSRNRDEPFKKIAYPIWDTEDTENVIRTRLQPILEWQNHKVLPACDPYKRFGGKWRCGCELIEEQARERGIWVD